MGTINANLSGIIMDSKRKLAEQQKKIGKTIKLY